MNVAVYFAQIVKIFARMMANFSAWGLWPHALHPRAARLWARVSMTNAQGGRA